MPSSDSIWDAHFISSNLGYISDIAYGGGYWAAVATQDGSPSAYHLYITQNLSSGWIDVPDYEEIASVDYIDTTWITGSKNGIYYTSSAGKLPAVSGEYGFTYIKAKEGFSTPAVTPAIALTLTVTLYVMPSFNGLTVTCPDGTTLHADSDKVDQTVTFTFTVNQYGTYTAEAGNGKEGNSTGSTTFNEGGATTQSISL